MKTHPRENALQAHRPENRKIISVRGNDVREGPSRIHHRREVLSATRWSELIAASRTQAGLQTGSRPPAAAGQRPKIFLTLILTRLERTS